MTTIEQVRNELNNRKDRSQWNRGVTAYALELLDDLEEYRKFNEADKHIHPSDDIKGEMLNGARDWSEYSYSGSSLIYDFEIVERLCTPSELKKKKGGDLNPNSFESWFDVQARALFQACNRIVKLCYKLQKEA